MNFNEAEEETARHPRAQVDELKTNLELEKQIAAQEKKDKQVTQDRLSSAVSEARRASPPTDTDVHFALARSLTPDAFRFPFFVFDCST